MERIWIMLAAVLVIAAAGAMWWNNVSAAFVLAALGAVAWFLSYRTQVRAKLAAAEVESGETETDEDLNEN